MPQVLDRAAVELFEDFLEVPNRAPLPRIGNCDFMHPVAGDRFYPESFDNRDGRLLCPDHRRDPYLVDVSPVAFRQERCLVVAKFGEFRIVEKDAIRHIGGFGMSNQADLHPANLT